jgi:GNAT superfamily N-acetyltransferase
VFIDGASFPPIRRLRPDDLSACVALSVDRGWSPEKAKWSLLLTATEPFGVDAPDGRGLAGAVVLTRWGPDLASVGMMLVAARYGRRGLGRALMEHLLAAAGDATVTLFATDMGRPLYEKLGFQSVRRNVSFVGRFQAPEDNSKKLVSRLATEEDLPAILDVDKAAFGADRGHVLRWLPTVAEQVRVIESDDGISGYAAAWRPHVTSTVLGPVVARSADAAKRLITDLAGRARTPVRLDLDPDRQELPGWAYVRGLEPVSRTVVMAHGDLPRRGTPECLFTPISVALA